MLNGLIMRLALIVTVLWMLVVGTTYALLGADFWLWLYAFSVVGLLPGAALFGVAFLIRWALGPVGRWGDERNRYTYEIMND